MIGDQIKKRRTELEMTQSELSAATGIKATTISNYENNVSSPSDENIYKLMTALKCDANFLFEWVKKEVEQFTDKEKAHIKKYRTLDKYGKKAVDDLLQTEYDRCTSEPHRAKVIEITFAELKVSAGTGEFLSDDNKSVITISDTPLNRSASYVVQVSGDSMEPEYHDKDMLLVKEQETVEVGEIGIFFLNGDGYVKKFGADRLISLNEKYDDILLHEFDSFKCFGKVLGKVEKEG